MRLKGIPSRAGTWVAVLTVTLATCVVILAVIGGLFWYSLKKTNSLPNNDVAHKVWWRLELYTRKATGRVPELTWADLWQMTRHEGGFGLEEVDWGVSTGGAVENPYDEPKDIEAGARLFSQHCAMCHGVDGIGRNGPPLNRSGHIHGDSDLAIYKVLENGIRGTAMVAPALSRVERWQVVGFLKNLMIYGSSLGVNQETRLHINVSIEQILSAGSKSDEWLTYSGSLDGRRYSPLSEINAANASQLRIRWIRQFETNDPTVEATPLVVDGTIFITEPPSNVLALDAKSGDVIWRYDRKVAGELSLCCGRLNRGVAVLGQTLFLASLDGYLVALDANTGKMIWETRVADYNDGYSMTGAPLIVGNSVVVGVSGGDYGIRGFLKSYDPASGKQLWKFNTVPDPSEPGHETWKEGWQTGGGPTWATGSYDPSLDLLYWGVGNPSPNFSGNGRLGDNLFTDSVIALHPSTGKLAWYFQFTPHDEHDWDSTQTPVLTDVSINGAHRKVICWANRNGFYYVLDRTTGEFLTGVPFVEQNWAKGLDSKGRPILASADVSSNVGRLTRPPSGGGTNWENTALDKARGLLYVHATEGAAVFTKADSVAPRDLSRRLFLSSFASDPGQLTAVVRALDVATGTRKWEYFSPPLRKDVPYAYSGLLATGGGLVLGASGGSAFALDSETGREVWRVFLGGDTRAAPISFTVDGKQVIAISAGRALFVFGL